MKKQFVTKSPGETEMLAAKMGTSLRGGETIELLSDVGGGKTTFTRGLAKGAGSKDAASSPSFTISNEYHATDFVIHHFDFYRLQDAGVVTHELHEKVHDPHDVVVVEWSAIVEHVLPGKRLKINIEVLGETSRRFTIEYPFRLRYLLQ